MTQHQPIEHAGRIVRAEIRTTAPVDQAWEAWAEPQRLSQWFTDRAKGRARRGGTITWIFDRFGSSFPYEVLDSEPPSRLVLKGSPPGRPPYLLEIQIEPDGDGCIVRVVNSGFSVGPETEEEYEGVRSGWQMALAILKQYLEHHFGRPKRLFFAMQPAPFDYEQILSYFLEEPRLARWLTVSGAVGHPDSRYSLILRDGSPMTGRVLTVTSREVALSWDEIDGVIELKAFRLGPRMRAVCVRGFGWDLSEEEGARVETGMTAAVHRLVAELVARDEERPGG